MLTRIRIKGYKTFHDVEVRLSPLPPDRMPDDSLLVVRRVNGRTCIDPFAEWGPLGPIDRTGDAWSKRFSRRA